MNGQYIKVLDKFKYLGVFKNYWKTRANKKH